jgi:hypothetical protein
MSAAATCRQQLLLLLLVATSNSGGGGGGSSLMLVGAARAVAAPPNATCRAGEASGGGDSGNFTLAAAIAWCRNQTRCAGFTLEMPCAAVSPAGTYLAHFKDSWGIRRVSKNASWSTFTVPGPRPPPPPPPIPPNPCLGTTKARWHVSNLGIGPHDLNAFFIYNGVYHIMHQSNWADWAHVVSEDGAHWSRLPSALGPPNHNGNWDGALTLVGKMKASAHFEADLIDSKQWRCFCRSQRKPSHYVRLFQCGRLPPRPFVGAGAIDQAVAQVKR